MGTEEKELLEELVSPVPELFRDVARHKIASKIGELAIYEEKTHVDQDVVIRDILSLLQKGIISFCAKN
ncbi:uncharacterized protein JNUCC1_03745 [Lentibacillus sp. JNUCC-1]|nr:uncharacterized protein [Lentibacillus sp. JNUCC-1]